MSCFAYPLFYFREFWGTGDLFVILLYGDSLFKQKLPTALACYQGSFPSCFFWFIVLLRSIHGVLFLCSYWFRLFLSFPSSWSLEPCLTLHWRVEQNRTPPKAYWVWAWVEWN